MPDVAYLAVEGLLRIVALLGGSRAADGPRILDESQFPWTRALSDDCDFIRAEALALLSQLDPVESGIITDLSVGVDGAWRLIPLVDRRGRYPYTDALPRTMAVLRSVPRLRAADFAILNAHSRIHLHVGNNWGVLRTHLTLVEAAGPGDCHLHFPDTGLRVDWREGVAFVFDDTHCHEAVNDRDGSRMVLIAEFDRPLPRTARWLNSCAQQLYRHHPVQRGVRERVLSRLVPS